MSKGIKMKIVFLDSKTVGDDISLEDIRGLGELVTYNFSRDEEIAERIEDADVVITNKCQINEATAGGAKTLS